MVTVNLADSGDQRVDMTHFDLLKVLGTGGTWTKSFMVAIKVRGRTYNRSLSPVAFRAPTILAFVTGWFLIAIVSRLGDATIGRFSLRSAINARIERLLSADSGEIERVLSIVSIDSAWIFFSFPFFFDVWTLYKLADSGAEDTRGMQKSIRRWWIVKITAVSLRRIDAGLYRMFR